MKADATTTSSMNQWNIATLKEHLETIMAERDSRYMKMFESSQTSVSVALAAAEKAVNAALAAQEKAVNAAFEASEKAIVKAEVAQAAYNERSNEFRKALDDQNRTMLPRLEADTRFTQLKETNDKQGQAISELQQSRTRVEGASRQQVESKTESKATSQWAIAMAVAFATAVLMGLAELIFYLATKH